MGNVKRVGWSHGSVIAATTTGFRLTQKTKSHHEDAQNVRTVIIIALENIQNENEILSNN